MNSRRRRPFIVVAEEETSTDEAPNARDHSVLRLCRSEIFRDECMSVEGATRRHQYVN